MVAADINGGGAMNNKAGYGTGTQFCVFMRLKQCMLDGGKAAYWADNQEVSIYIKI